MTQQQLLTLVTTIGLPVLSALAAFAIAYLRKKTAELTASIENAALKKYVELASDAALQAVEYTTQTYVDAMKEMGCFSAEDHAEAFKRAKDVALAMISKDAQAIISEAYGDFDVWISTKIEQLVQETKTIKGA